MESSKRFEFSLSEVTLLLVRELELFKIFVVVMAAYLPCFLIKSFPEVSRFFSLLEETVYY
jgi:uncharacterized Fe-S radical SAM superfamily protein PflX